MLSKATVVGTGAMGLVVAQLLAANRIHVALLARRAERLQQIAMPADGAGPLSEFRLAPRIALTLDPAAALANSELVITAVPSQYLRAAWSRLAPLLPPDAPLCSVTKGIETSTLSRPSEILLEYAPGAAVAVLSGPSIAGEIARCLPATVVVASAAPAVAELVQASLATSWFRVYTSADELGVELAGALKNVIALAAGILDGLHAGDNAKSALVTRGLVEITRLGVELGAAPTTFAGLAGVGDLVTTCFSPVGRNRSAGERIGRGESVADVVAGTPHVIEGIPTARAAMELAEQHGVEMPITRAVHEVLFGGKAPLAAITELMLRPPKAESNR